MPLRRHLAVTGPSSEIDPGWPYVWDLAQGFYFRPESGGALLCPCDEDPQPPGDCPADPAFLSVLARKVSRCVPRLETLPIRRWWAGHRTRRGDSRFVLGADPAVAGLIWAAGLGGHGVATSAAVGRRVANAVVEPDH